MLDTIKRLCYACGVKMKNSTKLRSLDRVERDTRVDSVWTEYANTGGKWANEIWCSLAPGYNVDGCGQIHAFSVRDFFEQLRRVKEGDAY